MYIGYDTQAEHSLTKNARRKCIGKIHRTDLRTGIGAQFSLEDANDEDSITCSCLYSRGSECRFLRSVGMLPLLPCCHQSNFANLLNQFPG